MIYKINTMEESGCWSLGIGISYLREYSSDCFGSDFSNSRIFSNQIAWCNIFHSNWSNHKNFSWNF